MIVVLVIAAVVLFLYGTQHRAPDGGRHRSTWLAGAALLAAFGWWYFTVYDTPAGRCDRGDLGACAVVILGESDPAS